MKSNVKDCFRECIGRKVVAVLFDALPVGRKDLAAGSKTLIFDDGTGLTIASNGSYWRESKDELARAVEIAKEELEALTADFREKLEADGVFSRAR